MKVEIILQLDYDFDVNNAIDEESVIYRSERQLASSWFEEG